MTEIATQPERLQADPHQVIDGSGSVAVANAVSQAPESRYLIDFQPTYTDKLSLKHTTNELESMEGITSIDNIIRTGEMTQNMALDKDKRPFITAGHCDEPILEDLGQLVVSYGNLGSAISALGYTFSVRGLGQSTKPRSNQYQATKDGGQVTSYCGSTINGLDEQDREPDPSRMIATAIQAQKLEKLLLQENGKHTITSHEALLLPYEQSFISEVDGKKYLTSCDIPWLGVRTNDPDGAHAQMLAGIENPIGIKIGPDDSAEKIAKLAKLLNPDKKPGKLIFIMRFGYKQVGNAHEILDAIEENDPNSIKISDPGHGNTEVTKDGVKTRRLPKMISEVRTLSEMCRMRGMRLHGLHLEASGKDDREECVDDKYEAPLHKSRVDPELNNRQLQIILEETRECFADKKFTKSIRAVDGKVVLPIFSLL